MATALPNVSVSPNSYSGGAVTFNMMPWLNYYTQKQQRDQAKEDAFYRFFGEMNKSVTPTGMAANDIPGLMQRKNQWQQYALDNKNAIAHPSLDGGKAYGEYLGRYNDMQSYIGQSQNKFKGLSTLQPVLRSPQKNALLNAKTMNDIHSGSLPLDHPDYKPFDPNSLEFNPQPFDIRQQNALRSSISGFKPSDDNPIISNIGNNQQQITHNYKFSPDQLAGMYNIGASQYDNNPSFRNMIDGIEHGGQYDQLNQVFKQHVGHDIGDEHDLAAAYVLSMHPSSQNKVEVRNIPYSPWDRSAAGLNQQEQFYDYRQQQTQAQNDNAEKFLTDQESKAKAEGPHPYTHADGRVENGYNVPFTPDQVHKIFGQRDITGKHILVPDRVQIMQNGDYLPIYYKRDEDGNVISDNGNNAVDPTYSKPVSREAVKASIIANKIVTNKPAHSATTTVNKKQTYGTGGLN